MSGAQSTRPHGAKPGLIVLLGSGETSAGGRRVWDWLLHRLPTESRVAILETPAGFEPNSDVVAERIAEFLRVRLQNYAPQVAVVPARKRGTPFSPDDPDIATPLLYSDLIFMGPGSPTYAARQLRGSLAWHMLAARHRLGAAIFLASSAVIAAGRFALPVYEIYKVGEDLHWQNGLDFLAPFGLSLVFIPHWDNNDGGEKIDTSRCYMGLDRYERLVKMLPAGQRVAGIDEQTALVLDLADRRCRVVGRGRVWILRDGRLEDSYGRNAVVPLERLGAFQEIDADAGIPAHVWRRVVAALDGPDEDRAPQPGPEVLALVQAREEARLRRDWEAADRLREEVARLGWQIQDTPEGPQLTS